MSQVGTLAVVLPTRLMSTAALYHLRADNQLANGITAHYI